MNRFLIFSILILSFGQTKSQTIEIGQDADNIKRLIEWSTNDHNKPDSFGNYASSRAVWDIQHQNGIITDVIQCFRNQYYLDLNMSVDYCKHYIMDNGKLAYILTQYENVSTDKLKKVYDQLYGPRTINELYFEEDFKHYSKIYLANNGYATIEWRKAELNQIPSTVRLEIENRQKAREAEEYQLKLAEKREEQKRNQVTSKIYDLAIYDKTAYNSIIDEIKKEITNYFHSTPNTSYYQRSNIPSFNELANSVKKSYRFANTYNAYYKLEDHSRPTQLSGNVLIVGSKDIRQIRDISLVAGTDKNCTLFDAIPIGIPTIQVESYDVMTEARFENLNIDYAKGITLVKIKKGDIEFINFPPDSDLIERIKTKLELEPKGKYILKYEVSKIMDTQTINTELEKKAIRIGPVWLLLAALGLLALL